MAETKERILDAAECLFVEYGIGAVPLRRIVAEAEVNSAAIHYHFGSKEELVKAVFIRRFGPVNEERLRLLDEVAERTVSGRPDIEDVCYAMVAPAVRVGQGTESGSLFRSLGGRLMTEPIYMELVYKELFAELDRRFRALLAQALPHLPEDVREWRRFMATGSFVFILREQELIRHASHGLCDTSDVETTIRRLVQFMAGGMKAPVAEDETSGAGTAKAVSPMVHAERKSE
jgi:AcrR family transcriptional regulator